MLRCSNSGWRHRRTTFLCIFAVLGAALFTLAACQRTPPALPQQAYIWQRQWTPAVAAAMQASEPLLGGWRVLAAELNAQRQWQPAYPDWQALRATSHAVVMVVRLDGQGGQPDNAAQRQVIALL